MSLATLFAIERPLPIVEARQQAEALRREATLLEARGEGTAARYRRRMVEHLVMTANK